MKTILEITHELSSQYTIVSERIAQIMRQTDYVNDGTSEMTELKRLQTQLLQQSFDLKNAAKVQNLKLP